jgi:Chalcone isomerase-like
MRASLHLNRIDQLMRIAVLACVLGTGAASAASPSPLPQPLIAEGFSAQRVGAGTLKWFGFEIYDAALWTPDGTFANTFSAEPVAFTLWYRRGFSRERLIEITRSAWTELRLANAEQQQRWSEQLAGIWLDVRKGSNMTTLVLPNGETRFYDSQRLLGRVEDPAFGPAFLMIWLDARVADTGLGELRASLLNQRESD